MFLMLNRMTIWTKNHQIIKFIVISIFINMMYAENFFTRIKSTKLALFEHSSSKKIFSDSSKLCFPSVFAFFVNTCFRAIFSIPRRGVIKNFMAMPAFMFNYTIVVCSYSFYRFKSNWLSTRLCKMPQTLSRTCNRGFRPIGPNFVSFFTMCTY